MYWISMRGSGLTTFSGDTACFLSNRNATLLHLLGIDHEKLIYRYQGRDYRLTDVKGELVKSIVA